MEILLEKEIISMYDKFDHDEKRIDICKQCRKENPNLSKAVGVWSVGEHYAEQYKKVLFVGKNARGNPAENYEENKNNKWYLNEFQCSRKELWNIKKWAYWSYTKEICNQVFGNNLGIEAVAFTNMVKCNDSETSGTSTDTTTDSMKKYCIKELQVIKEEIKILNPTHIIFYTGNYYNDWIPGLFENYESKFTEESIKKIGEKNMPFVKYEWNFEDKKIKALRVGHPERMKKDAYILAVSEWIRSS